MEQIAIALALVIVAATNWRLGGNILASISRLTDEVGRARKAHEAWMAGGVADWESRIREVEDLANMLPQRWDQIRKEAERLDGRARNAVTRARRELQERGFTDDSVESLASELQLFDGGEGRDETVQPVSEGVAEGGADNHSGAGDSWRSEVLRTVMGG